MNISQLTLSISLRDDATFANYFAGRNEQLLKDLFVMANGRGEKFVYLWGQLGSGRTHLLHACCHAAGKRKLSAIYLPLNDIDNLQPDILDDLEKMYLVCVDGFDKIAGKSIWEEAFLNFFNRMREEEKRLIIASDAAPQDVGILLPDLVSRLKSGMAFQIQELTDAERIQALILHAKARGLILPKEVAQFLWRRWPRDMASLFAVLEKLDQASLEAKRRLTIPFVKLVLGI
jgi:DnaA-homolog protein